MAAVLTGCGGGSHHAAHIPAWKLPRHYSVAPRPALPPGFTVASCGSKLPTSAHMGSCLPHPKAPVTIKPKLVGASPLQGPDTSNNDPILSQSSWNVIARSARFGIDKVSQGDYYTDGYAAPQAGLQAGAGLAIGGYDFSVVCDNPVSEGHFFAARYRAAGFLRRHAFRPWLDVEYGNASSCNARAWLLALIATVKRDTGQEPGIYTGAWYWNPAFGCWWPYAATIAWVSGYGVSYPYMPCGRSKLDIWQWTDHYSIVGAAVDWSTYRDGEAQFAVDTNAGPPPPPPDPYHPAKDLLDQRVYHFGSDHASMYNTLKAYDRAQCANPVRRVVCKTSRYHMQLLEARLIAVARHYGGWNLNYRHRQSDDIIVRFHNRQPIRVGSNV